MDALGPVPFGKYEGQPVEVLMSDQRYCQWLAAQTWFPARYPTLHQTIINFGGAPQDSPEHNQMQAAFLRPDRRLRLARVVDGDHDFERPVAPVAAWEELDELHRMHGDRLVETLTPAYAESHRFEDHGWDVTFAVSLPAVDAELTGSEDRWTYGGEQLRFCVELKPDLGDDFPEVLRQTKRYPDKGIRIVLVRRADFALVSFEQVKQMYSADGITLVREADMENSP